MAKYDELVSAAIHGNTEALQELGSLVLEHDFEQKRKNGDLVLPCDISKPASMISAKLEIRRATPEEVLLALAINASIQRVISQILLHSYNAPMRYRYTLLLDSARDKGDELAALLENPPKEDSKTDQDIQEVSTPLDGLSIEHIYDKLSKTFNACAGITVVVSHGTVHACPLFNLEDIWDVNDLNKYINPEKCRPSSIGQLAIDLLDGIDHPRLMRLILKATELADAYDACTEENADDLSDVCDALMCAFLELERKVGGRIDLHELLGLTRKNLEDRPSRIGWIEDALLKLKHGKVLLYDAIPNEERYAYVWRGPQFSSYQFSSSENNWTTAKI